MYRQSEKNLLSSNISSTCLHNMVNFGPLAAEIGSLVWGTPSNFNGFCVLASSLHGLSAKLCGVEQRAPSVFGRVAITLGIVPHSSWIKFGLSLKFGVSKRLSKRLIQLEMGANAKRDGHPVEYRWRPLSPHNLTDAHY